MQVTGKPSVRNVETLPNADMKAKEQRETLDNLIRQTIICDSFLSFTKARESPVQWIHWLDTLDQQNSRKGSRSSKLEVGSEGKDRRQEEILKASNTLLGEGLVTKDSLHSSVKSSNMFGRDVQTSGDRLHALKLPEAMVAIAQAAAKANDLPGWPLMSSKVQMLKCEKCSLEFFSSLNQRRHMRATHRRPLNVDKEDLKKKKEQVAAYWNKLTPEAACEIVSFKNISLADLSAASIVRALSTYLRQPCLLSLPQSYVRVATALLDIVQKKPSRFPLSSDELLNILEDASEKNLLCSVTSSSMQRCIFDGEPGRVGLETKNLLASLGFLVELRLVKAWMEDKDVEALRCQKVLVEEEEAAQKKRARLQERKRQKKMRQKESKDKERKGSECTSVLNILKFDRFSGENCPGDGEGDDSSTTTQSSPSSSVSCGQDPNHLDSSHVDLDDFECCKGGNAGGKSCRLDNAQQDLQGGTGGLKDSCWPAADGLFVGTVDQEEVIVGKISGGNYTSHDVPMVIEGVTTLQSSSHNSSQHADLPNVFNENRGEIGKSFMQFKTLNGKVVTERKSGGWGWKERKQIDVNCFPSHQKQPCSYDRRYQDYSLGSKKFSRKSYRVDGNCAAEFSGASVIGNTTPRYSQYREKYSGVKRPSSSAGSGHAVWARKTPQNSGLESERPDEKFSSNNLGIGNHSLEITEARQLQYLPSEDVCTSVAKSAMVPMCSGDTLSDSCCVKPEKLERLSCDSSISFDSVTSVSSSSAGRVKAEGQAINDGMRVSFSFSDQALSDLRSELDLDGRTGELNIASGAVVIGTLKISLRDHCSNGPACTGSFSNSQETLKRVSGDVTTIPGKKQKADVHQNDDGCIQPGNTSVSPASSMNADVTSKGSSDYLQEIRTCPSDLSRESSVMTRYAMAEQVLSDGEQVGFFPEETAKQSLWPHGADKLGHLKIWHPIGKGGHNDVQAGISICVGRTIEGRIPVVTSNSDVLCRDSKGIAVDSVCVSQPQLHVHGCSEDVRFLFCTGKTGGGVQESADLNCLETSSSSPGEFDMFERLSSSKETSGQHSSVGDQVEPSTQGDFKALPVFQDIASFLSQRWADAVTFSDSIDMATHFQESNDLLVKRISHSFSSPLADGGILGHCGQAGGVLHSSDHFPEFDSENSGCSSGLSCEDANF